MRTWRTEFSEFILDLLDFIEEKITEALENEDSRVAAIGVAAGAIPVLRTRLREDKVASAQVALAIGNMIEERYAADEWEAFAKMDRVEFESAARELSGPDGRLGILRKIIAEASGS